MGKGVIKIGSCTILHSGTPLTQVHGVALLLSPKVASSWEAAVSFSSLFQNPCEDTLWLCYSAFHEDFPLSCKIGYRMQKSLI